jgi:ATPase family associated with various cellular activities (AAA)
MYAETYRPTNLDDVIGHSDAKESLRTYLTSKSFSRAVMLSGPPGIGKTTLALAAAKTFGFDPLEINASRCIRSFEDVHKIKDACRSAVNIQSFLCGERNRKTCVILDEVDGSDPHAQTKIVEWIRDQTRKVPILCTGNELPTIFKRNSDSIDLIRCFPPKATELETVFPDQNIHVLTRECNYDIRRMLHRVQYGESYLLPKYISPPTGLPIEQMFLMKQKMFGLPELLGEYRVCILDTEQTSKTNSKYKNGGKHAHTDESCKPQKKASLGKLRKRK